MVGRVDGNAAGWECVHEYQKCLVDADMGKGGSTGFLDFLSCSASDQQMVQGLVDFEAIQSSDFGRPRPLS